VNRRNFCSGGLALLAGLLAAPAVFVKKAFGIGQAKSELLEHKLRMLANSVREDGSAYVYLKRNASGVVEDFEVLFAPTIHPYIDEKIWPQVPQPRDPAYCQVIDGKAVANFTADELLEVGTPYRRDLTSAFSGLLPSISRTLVVGSKPLYGPISTPPDLTVRRKSA
jgi:hypothetical protein